MLGNHGFLRLGICPHTNSFIGVKQMRAGSERNEATWRQLLDSCQEEPRVPHLLKAV